MGISLSGGPFSYNRFDDYQTLVNEKKADKDYDGDGKVESSKEEYFGSKDKAIKKAMGKEVSEEKVRSAKVETEKKLEKGLDKPSKTDVKEDQMAMYVRALGRMGGMYHPLDEKKDDEPTDERKEAADRADEEKRQKKEGKKGEAHETKELEKIEDKELSKEAFEAGWNAALLELPEEKVKQAKKMSEKKLEKGLDKDTHDEAFDAGYTYCINEGAGAGSPGKMVASVKKEISSNKEQTNSMKYNDAKQRRSQAKNAAEEFVIGHLIDEGLVTNETSAEVMMLHMSDAWYDAIISEMGPAYPAETGAQAKAQKDHRQGKSSAGLKTGKNPGLKASHTSGANRQD